MCSERAQTPPRPLQCRGEERWRRLTSENVSYKAVYRNIKGKGKVTVDLYPDLNQHQNSITARR